MQEGKLISKDLDASIRAIPEEVTQAASVDEGMQGGDPPHGHGTRQAALCGTSAGDVASEDLQLLTPHDEEPGLEDLSLEEHGEREGEPVGEHSDEEAEQYADENEAEKPRNPYATPSGTAPEVPLCLPTLTSCCSANFLLLGHPSDSIPH